MNFKDKYTIFIKNQKPISLLKTSCIIIVTIAVLLLADFYIKNLRKNDYKYTPVMENASYKATFVGDVMLGRSIKQVGENFGYNSLFKNVSNIWNNSNTVLCNFESTIIDNVKDYTTKGKNSGIYSASYAVKSLKEIGFNLISLANNHVSDYGNKGVKNTLKVLRENSIDYIGAGENIEEATKYKIEEVNGIRVAIISISDKIPYNSTATAKSCGTLTTNYSEYPILINKAKSESNVVIVYTHWGESYTHNITNEQEELAHNLINSGADIIIGTHQHTLQTIEKYNNGIILYGIGNFVYDQGWDFTKESALVNFYANDNGSFALELIPIFIEGAIPEVTTDFHHVNRIINTLTKRLNNTDYRVENNKLIIDGNFSINTSTEEV